METGHIPDGSWATYWEILITERHMQTTFRFPSRYAILGAGSLLLAACGSRAGGTPSGASPDPTTQLAVVNRSSSDMDIYMVRSGQRVRLGLAPANVTTQFVLTPGQVAGVGLVHFQGVPLLGLARPIGSEPVMLRAGDVVTLNIPPP